ncbi:MAG: hypothetical protein BVN35_20170 [Proteobacteria bacterium ST_bin11]|nr:MAG: hypothetical protein BVN35_20170 [Proteobacteria bacterium ST_bin11]
MKILVLLALFFAFAAVLSTVNADEGDVVIADGVNTVKVSCGDCNTACQTKAAFISYCTCMGPGQPCKKLANQPGVIWNPTVVAACQRDYCVGE